MLYENPNKEPTNCTPKQLSLLEKLCNKQGVVFKEPWLKERTGKNLDYLYQLTYKEAEKIIKEEM